MLATDGAWLEVENIKSGETIACDFQDFPIILNSSWRWQRIPTVEQILENSFDIRTTSRFNKLYVELLMEKIEAY